MKMKKNNTGYRTNQSIKTQNKVANNEIRKRFMQKSVFGEVFELEQIEKYIAKVKAMDIYEEGGFELEGDVEEMINSLRIRCVEKLRDDANCNLEWYEKRIAGGESPDRLRPIYSQAMYTLEKADRIQKEIETADSINKEENYVNKINWYIIIATAVVAIITMVIWLK